MEEQLKEALAQVAAETLRADTAESLLNESQTRTATVEGELRGVAAELANLKKERADVDVDKLKNENAQLKKQLQMAQKARQDAVNLAPDKLDRAVKERVSLITEAQDVLGVEAKLDTLSNREIRIKVIERLDGPVEPSAVDAFVNGCYAALIKGRQQGEAALASVQARRDSMRTLVPETKSDNRSAREKFLEAQNNACKIG